ncbi:MAG: Crp/Fnr family transcriptional regulator [Janthinobacterium lividum]
MNYLLSSLPNSMRHHLLRHAVQVEVTQGTVLHEPYEQPRFAYFPLRGVCSMMTRTRSGHAVETGMLGSESCTGATYLMGQAEVPSLYVQQVTGVSLRVPYTDLRDGFRSSEPLRDRILELVQVWSLTMGQLIACQRLHQTEQRLARWLLMVRQRSNDDAFQLSHEFLAEMLGCGRPKITLLLLAFRESGLVDSERNGSIRLRDVPRLQALACECHTVITELYAGLYKTPDEDKLVTS